MRSSSKIAIFISALFILISFKPAYSNTYFGIKGGLNYTSTTSISTGYKIRLNIGLSAIHKPNWLPGFSLQSELIYNEKGADKGELFQRGEFGSDVDPKNIYAHRDYLDFINSAKLRIIQVKSFNVNFVAGLYLAHLLDANERYIRMSDNELVTVNSVEYYKKFEMGFILGYDFEYLMDDTLLLIDFRYYNGWTDIYKSDGLYVYNRGFSVSVGWGMVF